MNYDKATFDKNSCELEISIILGKLKVKTPIVALLRAAHPFDLCIINMN